MNAALILAAAISCFAVSIEASAQDKIIKIGVLQDMSGPYADIGGAGSVLGATMAAEDSGLKEKGWTIEILSADHQNKPDIGSLTARHWADLDNVDVFLGIGNSAVALAVNQVAVEKNRIQLNTGAATSALTGKACTPNTIHWTYDSYELAKGTGQSVTKAGGDTWFFITADYTFGDALQNDTTAVVVKSGGKIIGSARHPLNSADFSSFLLQAQASKAKIIGLANTGADAVNAIKQSMEFQIAGRGQKLASLLIFITDIHALGLKAAQGLLLTESFYWDLNDGTRAFSQRFAARSKHNAMPTMSQAGDYAGTLHYLKTLAALGANPHDGALVVKKMKEMPTDDPAFGRGSIRADGRKIHPAYLFEVKTPEESKGPWDYYKLISKIPAEDAFRPLAESECPLIRTTDK